MFCAIIVLGKPGAAVAAEADDGSEMLAHSSNRQIWERRFPMNGRRPSVAVARAAGVAIIWKEAPFRKRRSVTRRHRN